MKYILCALICWLGSFAASATDTDQTAKPAAGMEASAVVATADIDVLKDYFFAAARTGNIEVLQTFLKAGFPVNERNAQSYTALMIAAYAGQADAVTLLLEQQADACLRDKRGHTALMGAMVKAEWAIARTLYAKDCDKDNQAAPTAPIRDKNQMTAAQFAEVFGQSDQFKALAQSTAAPQTLPQTGPQTAQQAAPQRADSH